MVLVQQADAAVVRDNNPVEAPPFAQDGSQQEAVAVPRLVIDVVVGGHDRTGVCQLDRHFKRQQEGIVQLAEAKMNRGVVARPFAERVAHVMLERRQQIALIALQPFHVGGCHHPNQPGIFPEGLFGSPPAHVAGHVQHRRKPLLAANGARLFANLLCRALHQRRVPGRAVVQRRWEQGGVFAQQPHQALLVEQRRDAKTRLFHHHALQAVGRAHAGFRVNDVCTERARDLPDAQLQPLAERGLLAHAGEFVAQIAALAVVAVFIEDQPVGVHLGELLFRGHARQ